MPHQDLTEAARAAAKLSRLKMSEERLSQVAPELASILEAFSTLAEVPVNGLDPMVGPHPGEGPLRKDEPRRSLPPDSLLANAPETEDGHYKVPRAVE